MLIFGTGGASEAEEAGGGDEEFEEAGGAGEKSPGSVESEVIFYLGMIMIRRKGDEHILFFLLMDHVSCMVVEALPFLAMSFLELWCCLRRQEKRDLLIVFSDFTAWVMFE